MKTDPWEHVDEAASDGPARISAGDLLARQTGQLKRLLAGMGIAHADAEDILQDVFVETSKRTEPFNSSEHAVRWLMRVTVNRCRLEFRRKKRFQKVARDIHLSRGREGSPGPLSPADAASAREELSAMREMLRELDESLLCPLVLRYFCGMDSGQIGEILDVPASTVRSRLRDGRMLLARRLMNRGVKP